MHDSSSGSDVNRKYRYDNNVYLQQVVYGQSDLAFEAYQYCSDTFFKRLPFPLQNSCSPAELKLTQAALRVSATVSTKFRKDFSRLAISTADAISHHGVCQPVV
jgi:hypothetical protein